MSACSPGDAARMLADELNVSTPLDELVMRMVSVWTRPPPTSHGRLGSATQAMLAQDDGANAPTARERSAVAAVTRTSGVGDSTKPSASSRL